MRGFKAMYIVHIQKMIITLPVFISSCYIDSQGIISANRYKNHKENTISSYVDNQGMIAMNIA